MNLKEAFRYQYKLQALMDAAQSILSCDANVTKVENTYLRHKVMAEAQDETVFIAPETEYYEQTISNGGTGYRFNAEGNQISYRCDVRRVTTINYYMLAKAGGSLCPA